MVFDSLSAAWEMGGHGSFVWSAYGLTLVVLLYLIVAPARRYQRHIRDIQADIRRASQPVADKPTSAESRVVLSSGSTDAPNLDTPARKGGSHAS